MPIARLRGVVEDKGEDWAIVTVGGVNLRSGPSTDCPVIGTLGFGAQVRIEDELVEHDKLMWRRVETPLGEGYTIASAYQGMPAIAPSAHAACPAQCRDRRAAESGAGEWRRPPSR